MRKRYQRQQGFSLIEVLIALSILALALSAGMLATLQNNRSITTITERSVAGWVARNELARLQLQQRQDLTITLAGQTELYAAQWLWRTQIQPTGDDNVNLVTITVNREYTEDEYNFIGYIPSPAALAKTAPEL